MILSWETQQLLPVLRDPTVDYVNSCVPINLLIGLRHPSIRVTQRKLRDVVSCREQSVIEIESLEAGATARIPDLNRFVARCRRQSGRIRREG